MVNRKIKRYFSRFDTLALALAGMNAAPMHKILPMNNGIETVFFLPNLEKKKISMFSHILRYHFYDTEINIFTADKISTNLLFSFAFSIWYSIRIYHHRLLNPYKTIIRKYNTLKFLCGVKIRPARCLWARMHALKKRH